MHDGDETNEDSGSLCKESADSFEEHQEEEKNKKHFSTKDGKFSLKMTKQTKKEKSLKKSALRFDGEGIIFKAKLIGTEMVEQPRGDRMCQQVMDSLKQNVRIRGAHKRKIYIYVSLNGVKIKDEKNFELLYHHPVSRISFILHDITDARAFGYIAAGDGYEFIAIKTEKPAYHAVVALRDLFQTVLHLKQEKLDDAKKAVDDQAASDHSQEKSPPNHSETDGAPEAATSVPEQNILFDVILAEPFVMKEEEEVEEVRLMQDAEVETKSVDELLELQDELDKLQQGIAQIDTSMATADFSQNLENRNRTISVESDPFDTSFVEQCILKQDVCQQIPVEPTSQHQTSSEQTYDDKYAVFNTLSSIPSIFDTSVAVDEETPSTDDFEDVKRKSTPPAKPPRNSKGSSPATVEQSFFAELDPLYYTYKTELPQSVKNPDEKVEELYATIQKGIKDSQAM